MLWDLNEGKHLYTLDGGDIINALCFSPNRYWLCAATGPSIKIWVGHRGATGGGDVVATAGVAVASRSLWKGGHLCGGVVEGRGGRGGSSWWSWSNSWWPQKGSWWVCGGRGGRGGARGGHGGVHGGFGVVVVATKGFGVAIEKFMMATEEFGGLWRMS